MREHNSKPNEPTTATKKSRAGKKQLEQLILGEEKIRRLKKETPQTYKKALGKLEASQLLGAEVEEDKNVWQGLVNPGRSGWVNSFPPEEWKHHQSMKESRVYDFFDTEANSAKKLMERIDLKTTPECAGRQFEGELDYLDELTQQLSKDPRRNRGARRGGNAH